MNQTVKKYKISKTKKEPSEYRSAFSKISDRGFRIFTSPNFSKVRKGKFFAYLVELPDYKAWADTDKETTEMVIEELCKDFKNKTLKSDTDFTEAAEVLMFCFYKAERFKLYSFNPWQNEETAPIN